MKTPAMVLAALLSTSSAIADRGGVEQLRAAATHAGAGRHAEAIDIYEQAFEQTGDVELLPVLGVQQRRAGAPRNAVRHFCAYMTAAPAGSQVWFARTQVIRIRRELGDTLDLRNVCAPTRVDFAPRPAVRPQTRMQRAAVASAR